MQGWNTHGAGRQRSVHAGADDEIACSSPHSLEEAREREVLLPLASREGKDDADKAAGGAAVSAGLGLGFMHTRDGRMAVLSMLLLVFQGTALSLILRYSRCVPGCGMHSSGADF